MPLSDLIVAGVELMILGMSIVFGFLVLLVFTLKLMSRLAAILGDEETVSNTPPGPQSGVTAPVGAISPSQDKHLIAVISAAVARYRLAHSR